MLLDLTDKKILFELEKDSSIPINLLGKKLKKSKDVISYRINRLKKENILRNCTAIVDIAKLGYITFRVYIRWQNVTENEKKEFYSEMVKNEKISTMAILHGKWDLGIFISVDRKSYVKDFHKIWEEILRDYKNKIADYKVAVYSPIYNFNKRFFSDSKEVIEKFYGDEEVVEYDETDLKIIHAFSSDVRQSLLEISSKTKVSLETVRRRINDLEKKKVIVGYKIDINLPALGFQGYRVDFALNSTSRNHELFNYIKNHKYFYQINKSIGGADFETEIVVKDLKHLLEILEEICTKFKDVIKNYEYMGYSDFPKLSIISD